MNARWKLLPRTFRIEWDLHAWCGIIASDFLFVIFFCGIFALFHEELHTWQDPALHVAEHDAGAPVPSFDGLLALARKHVKLPRGADVGMAFDGSRVGHAWINHEPTGLDQELTFDLHTGTRLPEHTRLADELYWMHFFHHLPGGQELAGVIAVGLFIAIVSGLLMHLKDLKRQFWSFRPRLRLRFAASDAHKVLGVFGLPFLLMFGWTGALLGLWGLVFSSVTGAVFGGDDERAAHARGEESRERTPANETATMRSFDTLVATGRAAADAGDAPVSWLGVQLYGDRRAIGRVYFEGAGFSLAPFAMLDARTGEVLRTHDVGPPSAGLERVLFALHYASYGGTLINFLYMLLAFGACAVFVTGNLVWLERRDPARAHAGHRFLERLTTGVCAGCVLSVAGYFVANRALPRGMEARGDWEFGLYLAVWAIAVISAFVPKWSARRAAVVQSLLASALFASVVVADLVLLDANIATAAARGVPRVLVIEVLLLLLSLCTAALGWAFARAGTPRTPR